MKPRCSSSGPSRSRRRGRAGRTDPDLPRLECLAGAPHLRYRLCMVDTPYSDVRREALDALSAGEPQRAFALFRWALEYPGTLPSDDAWRDALSIFAQIAAEMADDEFAEYVRRAANRPDDTINLYELGNQLIEQSLHGIAATVLMRAHQLLPGREQILIELVAALEGSQNNHDACCVLRDAGTMVEESFVCRYLLAYNAMMTGDVEEPEQLRP